MYFLNIKKLKEEIKGNKLSEKDRFYYVFVYLLLTNIAFALIAYFPAETRNIWDLVYEIGSVLIILVSAILAFRANGGSKGQDFLGKYFSISFVIAIRFILFFIPVFFILLRIIPSLQYSETTLEIIFLFLLWLGFLYWRVVKHISDVKV